MNWYIGQAVVCVNNKGAEQTVTKIHSGLKEGSTYTITSLVSSPCCGYTMIGVGIKVPTTCETQLCIKCGRSHKIFHEWVFIESRFRPLDELVNITELTEVLENTNAFEV